ncbi:hypothetical protein GCM10010389_33720 [Streptomyces echinoruber]|uniref:Uncharacterized protein n=1 Tax=Streptomyces echinoruber TaxID=68898 RepID=A0A918RCF1_9ACTN|nr:hypothetical protein GCM10010389_33720 [Streptomyces echinoruber]
MVGEAVVEGAGEEMGRPTGEPITDGSLLTDDSLPLHPAARPQAITTAAPARIPRICFMILTLCVTFRAQAVTPWSLRLSPVGVRLSTASGRRVRPPRSPEHRLGSPRAKQPGNQGGSAALRP